jgi:prefoldin subunit 5
MPNTEHELIQVAEHALNNAIRLLLSIPIHSFQAHSYEKTVISECRSAVKDLFNRKQEKALHVHWNSEAQMYACDICSAARATLADIDITCGCHIKVNRDDSIKYLRLRVKELMAERYKLEGELKALENKLRQIREISA